MIALLENNTQQNGLDLSEKREGEKEGVEMRTEKEWRDGKRLEKQKTRAKGCLAEAQASGPT